MFGDAITGMAADLSGKIYYPEDGGTTWTGTIKAGASRAAPRFWRATGRCGTSASAET
jgi:hypothetical protein